MRTKEELPECPVATAVSLISLMRLRTLAIIINQLSNRQKSPFDKPRSRTSYARISSANWSAVRSTCVKST